MKKMTKGLTLSVYRNANGTDSTNGGLSSAFDSIAVVGVLDQRIDPDFLSKPTPPRLTTPTIDEAEPLTGTYPDAPKGIPKFILVIRDIGGVCYHLESITEKAPGTVGPMFGGNFAATSDSRWMMLSGDGSAVKIHDRYETETQAEYLSR